MDGQQSGPSSAIFLPMSSLLAIAVLGFVLGMRHALDPDHVAAVTTIVSRQRTPRGAALIGALWGVGHTLTILVVGGGIILFKWVIPARVGLSMELTVGLMLIGLGVMSLRDYFRPVPEKLPGAVGTARPFLVGVVHGLAGSAAVALLVLTTISDPQWGVLYLFIFGLGTILGMMLITSAIAVPFIRSGSSPRLQATLRIASALVSILVGLVVAWQILASPIAQAQPPQ